MTMMLVVASLLLLAGAAHGAHIIPIEAENSSENYIDVTGLGEAYEFLDYEIVEIQLFSFTPVWEFTNSRMSDDLFVGTTADKSATCSLFRFISEDGEHNIVVGSVHDTLANMWFEIQRNANGDHVVVVRADSDYPEEGWDPDDDQERRLQDALVAEGTEHAQQQQQPADRWDHDQDRRLQGPVSAPDQQPFYGLEARYQISPLQTNQVLIRLLVMWTLNSECLISMLSRGCTVTDTTFNNALARTDAVLAESNMVHSNSGTGVVFEWVRGREPDGYVENGVLLDVLTRLQNPSDGFMDSAHQIREDWGADLVQIFAADTDFCGWATLFGNPPRDAFSTSSYLCTTPQRYTVVHEFGHNMGCRHDRGGHTNGCTDTNFNYGHRTTTYRTVMARSCSSGGCEWPGVTSCPREAYFSGDDRGGASNNRNRDQCSNTAPTIANYRSPNMPTQPSAPPPTPTQPPPTPTQPSNPTAPPPTICFSEEATVSVKDQGPTKMSQLVLGNQVLTAQGYQPIYGFGHNDAATQAEFVRIHTSKNEGSTQPNNPLEISGEHMVYMEGKKNPVRADSIDTGDVLMDATSHHGGAVVTKIDKIPRHGVYAPITTGGTLVVDGITTSCYVSLQDDAPEYVTFENGRQLMSQHFFVHTALAPARMLCIGVSPKLCDTYNGEGKAYFVALPIALFDAVNAQNLYIQMLITLVWFLLIGPLFILEQLLGPKLSVWVVAVGLMAPLPFLFKSFSCKNLPNKKKTD